MREETVEYIHLPSGSEPPDTTFEHRRVIIIIEQPVEDDWQHRLSEWVVASGCLYMMAWGRDCSSWDDSVDHANLAQFDYEDIPDEHFIMTTWHDDEALSEVFFHARMCAFHPTVFLPLLTILDITSQPREKAIRALHLAEKSGLLEDIPENPRFLSFRQRLKVLLGKR